MKIIKYLILLFLVINLNAYENYVNINQFNRNIQTQIESDLKNLNGYLSGAILKELYFKDGIYRKRFLTCLKEQQPNVKSGNLNTRIYFIKCYREFKNNFFDELNENYLNKKMLILNNYLLKHYNLYIQLKLNLLFKESESFNNRYNEYFKQQFSENKIKNDILGFYVIRMYNFKNQYYKKYYIKNLNYNIDNVGFRREWNERITQISALWSELLSEVNFYDKTWGLLDNTKVILDETLSDTSAREEHLKNIKRLNGEIYRQTKLLLDNLTEAIKDKFREDVANGLESIYE